MTKLLVIGDTHIGRTKHPETGRLIDPLDAFHRAMKYGIGHSVDAIIHVGDIFHETVSCGEICLVRDQVLPDILRNQIPYLYVHGNHAREADKKLFRAVGDEYVVHLNTVGTPVGPRVRVYGIDHYESGNIAWDDLNFASQMFEEMSILVLHQTLEQLSGQDPDAVDLRCIQRYASRKFDLVLCGHHHDAKIVSWNGGCAMYTGASEHLSSNNDPTDRVAWLITYAGDFPEIERYDIPKKLE